MKTLILDFDGTIADTKESIVATMRETLRALDLPQAEEKDIRNVIGLPLRDNFIRAAGITDERLLEQAMAIYREKYTDISRKTVRLFPHVEHTLKFLHDRGTAIAVASSKGRASLCDMLTGLGIRQYIKEVVADQDVEHKKPAPDMVLLLLERLGASAGDTLVTGDTTYDIAMGQGAGCKTCGVVYGNHTVAQLRTQGADFIVDDFADIIPIMEKN